MPAVESVLQLYNVDEKDGTITALDSYGGDVHLGTSAGHLIRLSVTDASQATATIIMRENSKVAQAAHNAERSPISAASLSSTKPLSPDASQHINQRQTAAPSVRTTVSRRCTLSTTNAAVQQIQHSRSQRVLFVLCDGRLLLLHAEMYTTLCTVATNVVSFSVAQPVQGPSGPLHDVSGGGAPSTTSSPLPGHSRPHTGWSTGAWEEGVGGGPHSRTNSHTRTSSEASYGSSPAWTPRSTHMHTASPLLPYRTATTATEAHASSKHRKSGQTHVVCVAERNKKELAVYVVDRVSTRTGKTARGRSRQHTSLSPSTVDLTGDATPSSARATPQPAVAPPHPRVVLRQRYMLPEPVQHVLMCEPAPAVAQPSSAGIQHVRSASEAVADSAVATSTVVEAGLTVCVGMRREVSVLPLHGGAPRCVLRLDGSRPPLLSVGSDHNTYLVRTQDPSTVMEVGVPPSAASAGVRTRDGSAGDGPIEPLVNPIVLRMGYQHISAGDGPRGVSGSPAQAPRGREDELIMGDVLQSDAAVELVLARFPFVFHFSADHCHVVSLLGSSNTSNTPASLPAPSLSTSLALQRIPITGVRHGALRGHGTSVFVASDRTVWSLQLYPLRAQLAAMVHNGRSEEAFQLLAFHQQRAASLAHAFSSLAAAQPLALLERDLHRMAGFACLYRGDITAAIRSFRGHLDPRELLLCLPDCVPPHAMALQPTQASIANATPRACALPAPTATSSCEADAKTTCQSAPRAGLSTTHVLHRVDTAFSAAEVRGFLHAEEAAAFAKLRCVPEDRTSAHASYWDDWEGTCVYNSCAGDVSRVWRATFDASVVPLPGSSPMDAENFVSSCYEALKEEVREWFAEELALPEAGVAPSSLNGAAAAQLDVTSPSCPISSCRLLAPRYRTGVYRRAMAYALLMLDWQARDFQGAYHLVVNAVASGLVLEDCLDMLQHLHEYRLLALLCFQTGNGEQSVELLRRYVCLPRTLQLPKTAGPMLLRQPTYVQTQLAEWRQYMEEKFQLQNDAVTRERTDKPAQGRTVCTRRGCPDTLVCGRGLVMQPSATHVRRVASLLFGVDAINADSPLSGLPKDVWVRLLDNIEKFYTAQTCLTPMAASEDTGFVRLHFTTAATMAGAAVTLPHAGPVLLTASSPSLQMAAITTPTSAVSGVSGRSPPLPQHRLGRDVGETLSKIGANGPLMLPSPLSEYFYAIETLDLCTLRRLLPRQPRLGHVRDVDGSTGLHIALAQVRRVAPQRRHSSSSRPFAATASQQMHERERAGEVRAAALQVICAVVGLLVHYGCPVSTLTCHGWSCLDVAAVACGGDEAVLDIVSAALLASVQLLKAETHIP